MENLLERVRIKSCQLTSLCYRKLIGEKATREKLQLDKEKKHRFLFTVARGMGLGNFIVFLPILRKIKQEFPNSELTLLNIDCKLLTELPNLDKYISDYIYMESKNSFLRLVRKIRRKNFDIGIFPYHTCNKPRIAFLSLLSSIPYRIGYWGTSLYWNIHDFAYNAPIKIERKHETKIYADILSKLNIDYSEPELTPKIELNNETKKKAQRILENKLLSSSEKLISIAPGSGSHFFKRWSKENFIAVGNKLCEKFDCKFLLLGSPEERTLLNEVQCGLQAEAYNTQSNTNTNLKTSLGLLKFSDIMISNDSGLMHGSYALDVPLVALFGPTDLLRARPLGKQSFVIKERENCGPCPKVRLSPTRKKDCDNGRCLKSISVHQVVKTCTKIMSQNS